MMNIKLANTPLFCACDIETILECAANDISSLFEESGEEFLSANQIGKIFLENIEWCLQEGVKDMRDMRT